MWNGVEEEKRRKRVAHELKDREVLCRRVGVLLHGNNLLSIHDAQNPASTCMQCMLGSEVGPRSHDVKEC